MKKVGFTIGKFAPLHKGHQYLIEKGLKEMDDFYVVVYETDLIKIPLEERASWIQKLYPTVHVLYGKNPPSQYGLDEKSVKIQVDYLKNIIKDIPVTHFYSSEQYGKYVAENMNVIDTRIDNKREIVPISATQIRNDIDTNKEYLNQIVFDEVIKGQIHRCITGG